MNYEKKYKEVLKKARKLYEQGTITENLCYVFPELKESEDEKIRNQIIEHIKWCEDGGYCAKEEMTRWISWLEKQGEQRPIDKIQLGKKYKCVASPRYSTFMIGEIYKPEDKFLCSLMNFCSDCFEPIEDGEQKPDDKVEPKFHEGNWIITNKNHIWYVDETPETTSYLYRLINQNGKVEVAEFEVVDKKARLWTIQDAKDGDMLYLQKDGKEHIIIYKGVIKEGFSTFVSAYCAYNGIVDAFCFADVSRYVDIAYRGIMPATKEQRDLLFKKMKEAGYEWDAEKKELKKIEQQSTFDVEIPFGAKDSELEEVSYNIPNGYHAEIEDDKVVIKKGGQKPAWSEEDETTKNNISHIIRQYDKISKRENQPCWYVGDCLLWMQNIKDRVLPQPKQEWSEDDERIIMEIISDLDYCKAIYTDDKYESMDNEINWLKSLRPQNRWKPSGEQLHYLSWIANIKLGDGVVEQEVSKHLNELLEDLKKLKA